MLKSHFCFTENVWSCHCSTLKKLPLLPNIRKLILTSDNIHIIWPSFWGFYIWSFGLKYPHLFSIIPYSLYSSFMYVDALLACMLEYHTCVPGACCGKKRELNPLDHCYWWLWAAMWALLLEPESYGRAVSAFNHSVIPPASHKLIPFTQGHTSPSSRLL